MQWHWALPPYSAAVFQGLTDISPLQGIPGVYVLPEGHAATGTKCCHAHRSADSATVCDFKINKQWFKAICQIPVSPSSQCGKYRISTHFGLHYTYFQTNPQTKEQQNFCESLLWYLWILIIATCNPYRIHININKFTLFNYYTHTRVQNCVECLYFRWCSSIL